jgi:hypothetical protein
MAIIQISRIIQRSGDLVDLPQLAEAELGWANDVRRLFVGRGGSYDAENVEVLTSYSSISFGQLEGSYGNLNFSEPKTGQIITYDNLSNTWVNTGGNAEQPGNTLQYKNFPIHLGNVDNVKVGGGSLGYVLETDGSGNLSWSPKGSLYTKIIELTNDVGNGNIITMTVPNTTPYTNSQEITITGSNISDATASNNINGNSFYVKLADDFSISGNVTLYTDAGLLTSANGSGLVSYESNSGVATAVLASASGGSGLANGITGAVQYKGTSGFFEGSAQLVWNTGTTTLNVSGNALFSGAINSAALSVTGVVRGSQIVSTVTSPTAPIVVSSSVRIANANVQTAGNLNNGTSNINILAANSNIVIGVAGTANVATFTSTGVIVTANANAGNLNTTGLVTATGNIQGGNLRTAGILSVGGNANLGNLGTTGVFATTLSATGNANVGNIGATNGVFTNVSGNGANLTALPGANVTGTVANATYAISAGTAESATTAGTVTTAAQPNITTVGTLTSLSVSGNANVGNIGATNGIFTNVSGNGNGLSSLNASNLVGQVSLTSQVTGVLPLTNGGTGQSTAGAALNALLPSQSGNSGRVLVTNGTNPSWGPIIAFPTGGIVMWSGSIASIPSGWALCDGLNGTPDLRDRFVVGAGQTYTPGNTGGSANSDIIEHFHIGTTSFQSVNHTHTYSGTTSVTGSHQHDSAWGENPGVVGAPFGYSGRINSAGSASTDYDNQAWLTSSAGIHSHTFSGTTDGQSTNHNHTFTTNTIGVPGINKNLPPYYALAFIMKL